MEAGFPAGRDQHRQRHGRDDRRRHGRASGRRQDRLHRPRRHGQDHPEGRRRHAQADDLRAGRQEPQRRSSPTPTWTTPSPARSTPSTSTAASAARPAAGCSSRTKIHDEFVERLAEKAKEPQGRRPARPQDRARPAGLAGAARQDPPLRRARREAGGDARDRRRAGRRQGLLRRADDLRQRQGRHGDRQATRSSGRSSACCRSRASTKSSSGPTSTIYGLAAADLDQGHRQGPPLRQEGQGRAPSGSTATTSSIPRRRSAASRCRARAARTARRRSSTTPS